MLTQKSINYQPHSRPKQYVMIEAQLRNMVQPDSRIERLKDYKNSFAWGAWLGLLASAGAAVLVVWVMVIIFFSV